MTEKLQQTIKEEVGKLSKEKQEAINSLDWVKVVEEIGKKHFLTDAESINNLQVETLLVLVGIEDLDSYARNIENEVGTSREEAEEIVKQATELIFTPIYNTLIEKIKNNLKTKAPDWKQAVNFVLSNGNYSVFVEKPDTETSATDSLAPEIKSKPPVGSASVLNIKSKLLN